MYIVVNGWMDGCMWQCNVAVDIKQVGFGRRQLLVCAVSYPCSRLVTGVGLHLLHPGGPLHLPAGRLAVRWPGRDSACLVGGSTLPKLRYSQVDQFEDSLQKKVTFEAFASLNHQKHAGGFDTGKEPKCLARY